MSTCLCLSSCKPEPFLLTSKSSHHPSNGSPLPPFFTHLSSPYTHHPLNIVSLFPSSVFVIQIPPTLLSPDQTKAPSRIVLITTNGVTLPSTKFPEHYATTPLVTVLTISSTRALARAILHISLKKKKKDKTTFSFSFLHTICTANILACGPISTSTIPLTM